MFNRFLNILKSRIKIKISNALLDVKDIKINKHFIQISVVDEAPLLQVVPDNGKVSFVCSNCGADVLTTFESDLHKLCLCENCLPKEFIIKFNWEPIETTKIEYVVQCKEDI